jgi:hypothetical protein
MKMLVYPGIESKNVREFVAALAKNTRRKKYKLGKVKTAVAKTPGTNDIVYEVVYLEVIDPQDSLTSKKTKKEFTIANKEKVLVNTSKYNNPDEFYDSELYKVTIGTREDGAVVHTFGDDITVTKRDSVFIKDRNLTTNEIPQNIADEFLINTRDGLNYEIPFTPGVLISKNIRPDNPNTITTDLSALTVDGLNDTTRLNSNLTHMKDNIREIGESESNFMPLWMRSSQGNQISKLGLVNAIPLCYCKPGFGAIISNKLDLENIDFSVYNIDIDRVIVDSTEGVADEQYIVFANYDYNV